MAAKKIYAIAVGRKPGIYENWDQARAQVAGYAGAKYKGFASRAEAEVWLRNPVWRSRPAKPPAAPRLAARTGSEAPSPHEIIIYSDGGARFNPGPGGYGAIIIEDHRRRELSGGFQHTTNNRMELTGCIMALRSLERSDPRPVRIHTDSQYVVNGIAKGWAQGWRRRGWRKGDGRPALNADLWAELLDLLEGRQVTFHWVRGHAGHPENERCDELAVAAAAGVDLPVDRGYQDNGANS
jgi:ribonuclease HI